MRTLWVKAYTLKWILVAIVMSPAWNLTIWPNMQVVQITYKTKMKAQWVHVIKECVVAVKQTSSRLKCNCPKIAWMFNWVTCSCGIMAFWVIKAAWSVSICCKKHYWQCYWLMRTWPNNKSRIVCNRENSKCEWTRECLCPLVKHPDAAVNIPACVMYSILDISLPPSPTPIPFPFPCSENWIEGN